jgi:hypothetical protein
MDGARQFVKTTSERRAIWHVADADRSVEMHGGAWDGEYRLTICGLPIAPRYEVSERLPQRALICERCRQALPN